MMVIFWPHIHAMCLLYLEPRDKIPIQAKAKAIYMLIACRECEHKVATSSKSCPHCGCSGPVPFKYRMLALLFVILTFAWVL